MARLPSLRSVVIAAVTGLALAAFVVASLVIAFDLRVEMAGSGQPIVSFGNVEDHFASLEQNRSQHYSRLLPAGPAAAVVDATPASASSSTDTYWTDFRGPNRDGRYDQTSLLTSWPASGLEPVWRQPIGGGYSSFVVAEGRAFTIEQRRDQEVVTAYEAETGRELWAHGWDAHFAEVMGGPGPRATPTWHDGRLYALGATGRLWALDASTGEVVWQRDILDDGGASNLYWAMAASPLIVDDLVIAQPGGTNGWSIAAYSRETGNVVWHVLDDVQSYTSPMAVTVAGVRQILTVTADRVVGLGIDDGLLLWDFPWVTSIVPNTSQPIILDANRIFLSAGYGHGAALISVTHTADQFAIEEVWRNNRMKNRFSSSVLHNGYIYGLDGAILACIEAATGELQWKGGRYGHGQVLLAGDHLVVLTEGGDLALVRATPEGHEEVGYTAAIEGKTWNVPALAEGRLLVRNAREMAAFDLRTP